MQHWRQHHPYVLHCVVRVASFCIHVSLIFFVHLLWPSYAIITLKLPQPLQFLVQVESVFEARRLDGGVQFFGPPRHKQVSFWRMARLHLYVYIYNYIYIYIIIYIYISYISICPHNINENIKDILPTLQYHTT